MTGRVVRVPGQMVLPLDVPDLTDDQRAELAAHIVPGWQSMGECRSTALAGNADSWFPAWDDSDAIEAARDACQWCPVRRSCLAYALSEFGSDDDHGIWGGTTEGHRDGLRQSITAGVPIGDVIDTIGGPEPRQVVSWADVA